MRAADGLPLRALVIFDELHDLARTRALLGAVASYRCDVRAALSGADAAAALRTPELDVVVLDLAAGADAALALLWDAFGTAPPPLVLLTDVVDPDADARALAAGVGALVDKAGLTAARLERGIRSALARHRGESAARGAGAYFRAGFDALQEHVAILDADGVIVDVNPAWERFAEANGSPPGTVWRGVDYLAVCDAVAPGATDAAGARDAGRGLRELLAGDRAVLRLQYPCHGPGEERWFVLRAVRFEAGGDARAYVAHVDVTTRVRAERATQASEARYGRVVETAHEGICTVDAEGRITFANGRLKELLGCSTAELMGASIFGFMEPEAAVAARARFARRQRGTFDVDELPFRRRDGSTMWARKSSTAILDDDGLFQGAVYVVGDRTVELEAQRRLAASERYFRALTEKSSELVAVLDEHGTILYGNPGYQQALHHAGMESIGHSAFAVVHPEDRDALRARFDALVATPGALETVEYRAAAADGQWRTLRSVARNLLHDPTMRGVVVNTEDITDRRLAEERLRENEERYRLLFERNPLPMYVVDRAARRFVAVNAAAVAAYGYSREEFLAMCLDDIEPEEDRTALAAGFAGDEASHRGTYRHRRRDGALLDAELTADHVTFDGRPARLVAMKDVTDRTAAAAERERLVRQLELERARLARIFEQAPAFICAVRGPDHTFELANRAYHMLVGPRELLGRTAWDALPELREQGFFELLDHVRATGEPFVGTGLPVLLHRAAGTPPEERYVDFVYQPIFEADGCVSGIFVHGIDVTERVRSEGDRERLLRRIEDDHMRLGELLRQLPFGVIIAEAPSGRLVQGNDQVERVFGHPLLLSADTSEYRAWIGYHADGRQVAPHEWPLARALVSGEHPRGEEYRYPRPGEPDAWIRLTAGPIRERTGRIVAAVVVAEDVTERRRADQASHHQRELLQAVFDRIPVMIAVFDAGGTPMLVNAEWTRVIGWTLEGMRHTDVLAELFPDAAQRENARRLATHPTGAWTELALRVRDGRVLDTLWAAVAQSDGSSIFIGQDVSERHRMAAQLRQAQKMEAVGQLAGGVAHDFNNLLMVISSYTLMLLSELSPGDAMCADLQEIQQATERAAALTGQLLAFSRQQVLDPRVVDLRQLVERMASMLGRLVREDVELTIAGGTTPTHVRADPGQIEQVVMNLAVNARDAMPAGGQLLIEVGTTVVGAGSIPEHPYVAPGEYACIRVRDTGSGMDAATQARIFDPFFTTKEIGKGTGLGLATVYGIVKQSGGYVLVDSAIGAGTTFRILLPHLDDGAPSAAAEAPPTSVARPTDATLLVVEDDYAFRTITERLLRRRGYTVLAARDGAHALEVAAAHTGAIDLVLTDVIMPHLSGPKLVEGLTIERGALPVLFMSGYSADGVGSHGPLRPGARLLHKPFTPDELALAISEVLQAAPDAAAPPSTTGAPLSEVSAGAAGA